VQQCEEGVQECAYVFVVCRMCWLARLYLCGGLCVLSLHLVPTGQHCDSVGVLPHSCMCSARF